MGRIVDYPEITTLSDGDYLIVDNAEGGTKKVSAQSVAGTVDPTPTESSTNAVSSGGVWTSLNDISEEFDGLRTDAYDVYPKGIASGDIVQFETGADNVPLSDLTGYIYPTMSGSGMPSRTNIRTISGPDDINIYQRNKNLIEQITYQAEPETVYLGVQNSSNLTMFFKAGDYRITVNIVGGSTVVPYWSVGSTATHSEYMHLDNDTNVSIYVYDADGISASDIASFQVEVGTEATDYIEFEGDITNVVLPTDRGTIYSGRVALTAGKVYIDTVIYERNSSTMNNTEDKPGWAYTGLQTYDVAIGTFDDVIYWPNGDVRCTNVNVGSTYSIEAANEDYSLILPRDVYNMSQSQWISAGVDIQILVKLNTPIEIDIDPVEVRSLYGFNTYYCNSGKTGVIFGMDLAKYISDKTTEVQKEEQAKLEKAFATDTASGAVATFADGADDIPMKSVKVAIEPVQDLHGYDHPWPAGGGKNLLYVPTGMTYTENGVTWTLNQNGSVTVSGTATEASIFRYIQQEVGEAFNGDYYFQCFPAINTSIFSSGVLIGGTWFSIYSDRKTALTGLSGKIQQMWFQVRAGQTLNTTFYPMIYKASETVSEWSPYSNICPISGWTGAQVVRTGKNLLDDAQRTAIGKNIRYYYANKRTLLLFKNVAYTISTSVNPAQIQVFDDNDVRIATTYNPSLTFTPSSDVYVHIDFYYSSENIPSGGIGSINCQLELGSTATSYEPYTGSTYSITLPTEAGTVYGGTLDVTSGVLTVDRAMVDLGTLNWYKSTATSSVGGSIFTINNTNINMASRQRYEPNTMVVSSLATAPTDRWFTNTMLDNEISSSETATFIAASQYSDVASFKAGMSGVQFCYELATPTTYHLAPTEIKSLLGENNIYSDCGNTEVTYRADTAKYIDKKIAEVINALS